jgi:hypothetical protein
MNCSRILNSEINILEGTISTKYNNRNPPICPKKKPSSLYSTYHTREKENSSLGTQLKTQHDRCCTNWLSTGRKKQHLHKYIRITHKTLFWKGHSITGPSQIMTLKF